MRWRRMKVAVTLKNKSAANEKLELGELMIYNGNRKAGILALEQAVQLNPDLLQAHTDLANVLVTPE